MVSRKLKASEVPKVREALRARQDAICPLCHTKLTSSNSCLDHDHTTGAIRGVLCRNCNGIEGKIKSLVRRASRSIGDDVWLDNLREYRKHHSIDRTNLVYPTHKTEQEKRLARNARARKRRAAKKAM